MRRPIFWFAHLHKTQTMQELMVPGGALTYGKTESGYTIDQSSNEWASQATGHENLSRMKAVSFKKANELPTGVER